MNCKLLFTKFLVVILSTSLASAEESREKQETDYYTQERVTDTKDLKEIQKDRKVKLDYTLKVDGENVGDSKRRYTQGKDEMEPWLEAKLEGL